MEVEVELTVQDWRRCAPLLQKFALHSSTGRLMRLLRGVATGFVVGIGAHLLIGYLRQFHPPTATWITAVFVTLVVWYCYKLFRIRRALEPMEDGLFLGVHRYAFSDDGIRAEGRCYRACYSWQAVRTVVRSRHLILILLDRAHALVFPVSQIEDPDAFVRFLSNGRRSATAAESSAQDNT
jgi:hypothetical protein